MIYKNKPECKTIATYVPVDTYVELMNMADARTKKDGEWWSLSRLVREILILATEAEKAHMDIRAAMMKATGVRDGKRA